MVHALQGSIILNGRRPLQEAPRVRRIQKAFRVDNGLRGPAAGRAQQEARAAAAAAAAQQQLRSEADVRALMEVSTLIRARLAPCDRLQRWPGLYVQHFGQPSQCILRRITHPLS